MLAGILTIIIRIRKLHFVRNVGKFLRDVVPMMFIVEIVLIVLSIMNRLKLKLLYALIAARKLKLIVNLEQSDVMNAIKKNVVESMQIIEKRLVDFKARNL